MLKALRKTMHHKSATIFHYVHCVPLSYRQALIFQHIYHIKLATLIPCRKFKNRPPLQTNILLGSSLKF